MNKRLELTRRQFSGVLAGGTISLLAGRNCLAASDAFSPYFFIVAADPQLFWSSTEDWKRTIGQINRLAPRFAVVCGDLINRNGDAAKIDLAADEKMAQAYLEGARTISPNIPLHNVAGNHDVCNRPTNETLAWYQKRFGELWYTFTENNSLFIVLESDLIKAPEGAPEMAERQMKWLTETLEKRADENFTHKIVFMHHPLCTGAVDEADGYFNLPKMRRMELLALFHKHNVHAVFSGHRHQNHLVTDGDLELVTSSSCGRGNPPGLRIVKVYADRIEHAFYAMDQLPELVEMNVTKKIGQREE